jgi:hypothetical protein
LALVQKLASVLALPHLSLQGSQTLVRVQWSESVQALADLSHQVEELEQVSLGG